jgi:glycosyltransferase involved in cell wall biosynthesis
MKVLHVIRDLSPETGGPVSAIRGLTTAQRQLGHDVRVVSTDYGYVGGGHDDTDIVILCRCTVDSWRYAPSMKKKLTEWIQWCDVVHIHTIWEHPTLLATRLAWKFSKPYLLRPCGMLDSWSLSQSRLKKGLYLKLFSSSLFQRGNLLHFTTNAERDKSHFPDVMDSVVIGNGLSKESFLPRDVAKEFNATFPELTGKKLVLFLGRVDPKKQPDVVIRAFSEIVGMDVQLHLVVAGPYENAYRADLERIAIELGIVDRVMFTGMLSGNVLYGAYRAAFLYVLPSHQENFGISVAEAMAGFCPVIVSEHVDIKDVIADAGAGRVCSSDYKAVAQEMRYILNDPILARKMGENGRRVAEQFFKWDMIAEKLDKVYELLQCDNSREKR